MDAETDATDRCRRAQRRVAAAIRSGGIVHYLGDDDDSRGFFVLLHADPNARAGRGPGARAGAGRVTIADVLANRQPWHVECADVRAGLAMIPDGVIHCVVTSPPYWSLRAYQTEPQVWGSAADCAHTWGDEHPPIISRGNRRDVTPGEGFRGGNAYTDHKLDDMYQGGAICQRCGAWRGELGSEPTVELYVAHMVEVFREVRRVLRADGTVFLNVGDSYYGSGRGTSPSASLKPKDLCLIPERLAIALQDDGWWVRSRIAWCKTSAMPESVTDRPTSAWEHIWILSKAARYFYDADAVRTPQQSLGQQHEGRSGYRDGHPNRQHIPNGWQVGPGAHDVVPKGDYSEGRYGYDHRELNPAGANLRNYWVLGPEPFAEAHFATFPSAIPERCLLAGTSARGVCPACGAPWRRVVERKPSIAGQAYWTGAVEQLSKGGRSRAGHFVDAASETTGWEPGCTCDAGDPIPALCLDPFAGSGTTIMESLRHGRRALGLELSPAYAEMARSRIIGDAPLFNGLAP